VKRPRLLLAALVLLIGAASAAGSKLTSGPDQYRESAMQLIKHPSGS
jgi:hypothetical protein